MSPCRIKKLEILGFRAFGRNAQTLEFPSLLAAVWGPNSQGKTSLAEAIEFLLTGQIVRRALMASGQDEFADALRNAHLPANTSPFVQATITGPDGAPRVIKRILKTDYGKKQDCETLLEIDGKPAAEADLAPLGIVLSQPPLRAPVLAQHTLGYLFSARPQDRSTYFKALLEVIDLEEFRSVTAALEQGIAGPPDPLVGKLIRAAAVPLAERYLNPLLASAPSLAAIDAAFAASCKELIEAHGESAPADHEQRIAKLESILAEKRAKTFALKEFDRKPAVVWTRPAEELHGRLPAYVAERAKVDEQTRRMTTLFREALALPTVAEATEPIDCPLCKADGSLTPQRIAFIRERVADTESFQNALKEAREALAVMATSLQVAASAIADSLPMFITNPSKFRRARGFRVHRIVSMLGAGAKPNIDAWLAALRRLVRRRTAAITAIRELTPLIDQYAGNPDTLTDPAAVKSAFTDIAAAYAAYVATLSEYDPLEKRISAALKAVVDAESQTAGWQELIDLARDQENVRTALIDRFAREQTLSELRQAVRQIDKGNEQVLEEKFQDLSDGIQHWWDLLRPDELSFFKGVVPRPGARRTIDFKAGLATQPDRSDPKFRDVVAVFSQSQLHCLGLALFLARSVKESAGFIVLDDPILSSDEDYRAFFNAMVIEDLLNKEIQVIILTQDQRTWKNLGERYLHRNIRQFQIVLESPADGSMVADTADDLETQFIKADMLVRGGHPSLHKQGGEAIRDAAERFCKEVLVKSRRAKGDLTASLTDYDGKNLGDLSPQVEPLLVKDPSHPGKLRTIGAETNPAKHDDAIPQAGTLKVALGDLRYLKRNYL
jgi:hypothetical protein